MLIPVSGFAGYQEGLEAYKAKDYTTAINELNPLAESGSADAEFLLGDIYGDTTGSLWNNDLSVHHYRKAASQGNAAAAFKLGEIYEMGTADLSDVANIGSNDKNHAIAVQWFREAAVHGNIDIKLAVAKTLQDDEVESNRLFSIELYKEAAASGTPKIQLETGISLASDSSPETVSYAIQLIRKNISKGTDELKLAAVQILLAKGAPQDKRAAIDTLSTLASMGNLEARTTLGICYLKGTCANQDNFAAALNLKMAADDGYAEAQLELAGMYIRGQGVAVNFPEAIVLLDKAVAQNYPGAKEARNELPGQAVIKGDYKTAMREFRPRADNGEARPQWWVGYMYEGGLGVEQSYDKAIEWYIKSSLGNDRAASYSLGELYSGGNGIPADYDKAEKYFTIASKQGHSEANEKLGELKKTRECVKKSSTLLFGESLNCTTKRALRLATKVAGAKVVREDDNYYYDQYDSRQILDGTIDLYIGYFDGKFAKAFYQYDSQGDDEKVVEVRNMVASKYGKPLTSKGNPSLGPVLYTWKLKDGIIVEVKRDWPDTTVFLSYVQPVNVAAMQTRQNKQKLAEESSKRNKQKQAF